MTPHRSKDKSKLGYYTGQLMDVSLTSQLYGEREGGGERKECKKKDELF